MGRSTVHYTDSETNNILKRLHNKLRPAGTPVERVEYIIELLLLRIFETKVKQDVLFAPLRKLFEGENYRLLFSHLLSLNGEQILSELNKNVFPFYASILSKARTVVTGNLPQKMQDQLVLTEEVFANSNFTNNVKGGVIAEVIGLVNEIEEKHILKTDLLGDAIESALSETGGTKDLGLYRTPDHIRQMMVQMVDPDFTDTIFDPACGTAGFLFDAYDYVIEQARITRQYPAENVANAFYRAGIGGIEYQGRIRKMAAVNMYIRGLNPHNIEQGDSLKMFEPSRDGGSKSVVIANPPFGAERDQPAYPNIWEEYSKESETTILFVKLMFDLLKANGRCAVVVSEGFLTWGQNSACALRKLLLNEANLRAIISLPQGVFVSKSGQGAKTSILYFERGLSTDFIWYYKVENDGFSMGTNRKPIEGSQIPELLELFKVVKQGKKPQDTIQGFCISKEQIETLDPRMAERIRIEVKAKSIEKNTTKREKLVLGLNEKIANKKISREMCDEKLWQFDNVVEGQIDNEVAKAIEKAHTYNLNLQNYRSNLSDEQIKDWKETMKGVEIKNGSKIEKRYQELQKAESKVALQIIASFDCKNGLQMDITRDYLSKLEKKFLEKDEKLQKIEEILRKGFQYPNVPLFEILECYENRITIDEDKKYKQITVSNTGEVKLRDIKLGSEIGTKSQVLIDLSKGDLLIYSRLGLHTGAIGLIPESLDGAVVTVDMPVFRYKAIEVNPKYVALVVQNQKFVDKVIEQNPTGSAQTRFHEDKFLQLQIPLPSLEVQNEIVGKIEKQKQIINGAEWIEDGFKIFLDENNTKSIPIRNLCKVRRGASPRPAGDPKYFGGNKYYWLKISDVPKDKKYTESAQEYVTEEGKNKSVLIKAGDIILTNSGATLGYPSILKVDACIHDGFLWFESLSPDIDKEYLFYVFKANRDKLFALAQTGTQPNLNTDLVGDFEIPLPSLKTQRQIVEKLDRQMQALESVRLLKSEAEKRIEKLFAGVWGE
jgi:type I restriction-modification system DNA methylase subunit/restriction endonuclease S subunit